MVRTIFWNSGKLPEGKTHQARQRRWLRMSGIGFTVVLLAMVIAGRIYEFRAVKRDLHLYPPPGQVVIVGSHHLHLQCMGRGKPAVIFDSGAGGTSLDWRGIQHELTAETRVCAYDRAGFGWSDPGPSPRTSQRIVDELRILLKNAEVAPPFILVGHSFGGLNMQLFAARYPDEVAGLVLVDSVHPQLYSRMPHELRQDLSGQLFALRLGKWLAPLGVPRLLFPPVATQRLPRNLQLAANARGYGRHVYSALYEEAIAFDTSCEQIRSAPSMLESMPLTLLTRSKPQRWPSKVPVETAERTWQDLQRDLAGLVPGSKHVVVENAGHFIHIDQPQAVVEAIKEQLQFARK